MTQHPFPFLSRMSLSVEQATKEQFTFLQIWSSCILGSMLLFQTLLCLFQKTIPLPYFAGVFVWNFLPISLAWYTIQSPHRQATSPKLSPRLLYLSYILSLSGLLVVLPRAYSPVLLLGAAACAFWIGHPSLKTWRKDLSLAWLFLFVGFSLPQFLQLSNQNPSWFPILLTLVALPLYSFFVRWILSSIAFATSQKTGRQLQKKYENELAHLEDKNEELVRQLAATEHAPNTLLAAPTHTHPDKIEAENHRLFQELHHLKQQVSKLQNLARTDELTRIYNRRYFLELGRREFVRSERLDSNIALVLLDIDRFKQLNDTHGHLVGDQVLRELAHRLSQSIRENDILARYGGEEFVIILPDTDLLGAQQATQRLQEKATTQPISTPSGTIQLTISIGIATKHKKEDTLEDLLKKADAAMYRAKRLGRNQIVIYDKTITPLPSNDSLDTAQ